MQDFYLRKILWWIRFMVVGLIIWAIVEAVIVLIEH